MEAVESPFHCWAIGRNGKLCPYPPRGADYQAQGGRPIRFSLPTLFMAVSMSALACAAMINRTRWWVFGIIALTILLFIVAAVRAIRCRGRDRAALVAFAVAGSCYLLLTTAIFFAPVRQLFATHRALIALGKAFHFTLHVPINASTTGTALLSLSEAEPVHRIQMAYEQMEIPITSNQVLSLDRPIPRASVKDKKILQLTMLSPHEIQVAAKKAGVTQCSFWNEEGQIYTVDWIVYGDNWDDEASIIATFNPAIPAGAFLYIGHCVCSWLLALLSGWMVGWLYGRREKSSRA